MDDQLADSAEKLFGAQVDATLLKASDGSTGEGTWPERLWNAVGEAGLAAALLPEEKGGFGASVADAFGILRIAAAHAAPIPLAETMLAGRVLAEAGLAVPEGVLTVAPARRGDEPTLARDGAGWRLTGTARRVPWGARADAVAVVASGPDGPALACVRKGGFSARSSHNVAGEPRDTLSFDGPAEVGPTTLTAQTLRAAGAALRTAQIAGALSRILDLCVGYAQTRVQFGRPIGKFQAIQQNLAVLAGQGAAAVAAADIAAAAFERGIDPFAIGAAKARAGEAASVAAALAHQAHGAIGFTQEYALHPLTRRLWAWREEFGNEAEWNALVGRAVLKAGAEGLWPAITAAA